MNIDDKIKAKIESIDKKLEGDAGINLIKLQSYSRDLEQMGNLCQGNKTGMEKSSIKDANQMIAKLMHLQVLAIFEDSIEPHLEPVKDSVYFNKIN